MESLHMRPVIKKHCLTLLLSGTLLCFSAVFLMYISASMAGYFSC